MLRRTIVLCLLLAPFCAASNHWDYEESHDEVRDFVAGGMLHVRLSVGDVRIMRSDSNKISLRYTVKSRRESHVKDAHVDFEVRGNDARIEFHASSGGNTQFDVQLEVPQNTNLDVHEKVGDLTVADIAGDKELELGVGDIRVAVGRSDYHLVRASTSIGDVNGDGYGETSGWLGKTLKYRGDGKYELRARGSGGYYAGREVGFTVQFDSVENKLQRAPSDMRVVCFLYPENGVYPHPPQSLESSG